MTAIVDLFPDYLRVGRRREMLVGVVCLVDCAIGCTMVMQVGATDTFLYKFCTNWFCCLVMINFGQTNRCTSVKLEYVI